MSGTLVAIIGNTYPVKDEIKALGGRWDATRKCWMVPQERADEARTLVEAQPAWVCDECGAELSRPWCPGCRDEMFIRQVR